MSASRGLSSMIKISGISCLFSCCLEYVPVERQARYNINPISNNLSQEFNGITEVTWTYCLGSRPIHRIIQTIQVYLHPEMTIQAVSAGNSCSTPKRPQSETIIFCRQPV